MRKTIASLTLVSCVAACGGSPNETDNTGVSGKADSVGGGSSSPAAGTWKILRPGQGLPLTDIAADGAGSVYAMGDEGIVYSIDNGANFNIDKAQETVSGLWITDQLSFIEDMDALDSTKTAYTAMFNAATGVSLAQTAPISHTVASIGTGIPSVAAQNGSYIALLGETFYESSDGGATFKSSPTNGEDYTSMWVANAGDFYATFSGGSNGIDGSVSAYGVTDVVHIIGQNHIQTVLHSTPVGQWTSAVCGFGNTAYLVGTMGLFARTRPASGGAQASRDDIDINDAASEWQILPAPAALDFQSCAATDANNIYIATLEGHVLHSADAGATWTSNVAPINGYSFLRATGNALYLVTNNGDIAQAQ